MRARIGMTLTALIGAVALMSMADLATPAFGDDCTSGCGITATVQVPSTVTITGLQNVTFPVTPAGSTATVPNAEVFTVGSNDGAGYTLSIAPGATNFHDTASFSIPNTDLSITNTWNGNPLPTITGNVWNGTTPVVINQTGVATGGVDNYSENWSLMIPGGQYSASYSESFTYTATGN